MFRRAVTGVMSEKKQNLETSWLHILHQSLYDCLWMLPSTDCGLLISQCWYHFRHSPFNLEWFVNTSMVVSRSEFSMFMSPKMRSKPSMTASWKFTKLFRKPNPNWNGLPYFVNFLLECWLWLQFSYFFFFLNKHYIYLNPEGLKCLRD